MAEKFVITHPKIFTVLRRARALLHAECLARRPGCGGPRHVEADAVQHGDGRVRGLRGADEEVLHVLQTEIMIMIFNMIIIFIIIILTLTWSPIIIIMRDTGTPGSLWFIQLSS